MQPGSTERGSGADMTRSRWSPCMSKESSGIAFPTLIAFAVAGMAFTASLVLAYYATHSDKLGSRP